VVDTSHFVAWIAIVVQVGSMVAEPEPPFIRRDSVLPRVLDLNLVARRFDESPDGMI
jgi:hypothetical protein